MYLIKFNYYALLSAGGHWAVQSRTIYIQSPHQVWTPPVYNYPLPEHRGVPGAGHGQATQRTIEKVQMGD